MHTRKGTSAWDQLSIDSAQLLLCDLQPKIIARGRTIDRDALSKSAGVLLEIAKLFSLPTTLSVVPEGDKAPELISELRGSGFAQAARLGKPVFRCGDKEFARAVQAQGSDHWWIRNGSSGVACGARRPRASLRGVGPSRRLWRNVRANRTGCSKADYSRGSHHHLSCINCNEARARFHDGPRQGPFQHRTETSIDLKTRAVTPIEEELL
jgi:hypothetical protein